MDSVSQILQCCAPPASPAALDFSWQDVECHLGVRFPDDFKQLILHYGRGVFQPSSIRLCNYLDGKVSVCDEMIEWAQSDPASYESIPFSFYPTSSGLLPLASYGSENFFFLNPLPLPSSIVYIRQNGRSCEEIHGLSVSEVVMRSLHLKPDQPIRSISTFLTSIVAAPSAQQFLVERHEQPVDPAVCRTVAIGGGRVSYRLGDLFELTVSQELLLHSARRESVPVDAIQVIWDWRSPHANSSLAPECSFGISVIRKADAKVTPQQRSDQLHNEYYSSSVKRQQDTLNSPFGLVYRVLATKPFAGNEGDCDLVLIGEIETIYWELTVHVPARYLSHFLAEASRVVQSVRLTIRKMD